METIHLKTIDPVSQGLLRSAAQRGANLSWERYEKLQPQDGFLRLGLSCPFGCLQGPCRIDPFNRGSQYGLCGLGREGMVAAMLLRLCLQGALETYGFAATSGSIPEAIFSTPLDEMASRFLAKFNQNSLSATEIFESASLLQRPSEAPERLIQQALRLSLITLGILDAPKESESTEMINCQAGYGLLAGENACIGLAGHIPREDLENLLQETRRDSGASVQLVSLGDWISIDGGFVPLACSSGEGELLASAGGIDLLVAGSGTDPGLMEMCDTMQIPTFWARGDLDVNEVTREADRSVSNNAARKHFADPAMKGDGRVVPTSSAVQKLSEENPSARIVILGGADSPQQSLGYLPVELTSALRGENFQVFGWGDAAVWMLKNGMASEENEHPVRILDNHLGPISVVKGLASAGNLGSLEGICFTGLKRCQDLNMALGLACLGLNISIAVPIPLWGSDVVCKRLSETIGKNGGSLTHFDHPAQVQEIMECFPDSGVV